MSVQEKRRIVTYLAIVVLALGFLWPVRLAASVGTTYLYQWQELGCASCPTWVKVSQLGAGEVTLAEGESLAHAFYTTGLTPGATYYFVVDSYLYKSATCGYDRLVQYDYTSRLNYSLLPGDSGPRTANGSLSENAGGVGYMYTSGVVADSVTVGSRQTDPSTENIISSYWPVRFTAASSTVYFYFALELSQPGAYDPPDDPDVDPVCTVGASGWDGVSLEANISDSITRIQTFFTEDTITTNDILKKDGPRKLVPSGVLTTVFSGQKWYDLNVNGARTADEPFLSNWTIKMYDCSTSSACDTKTLLHTTTTDATGGYYYSGVSSDVISDTSYYQICEVLPTIGNWITSYPSQWGTGSGTEFCHPAVLGSATLPVSRSFGNFQADWGDLPDGAVFGQTGYTWTSDYKTLRADSGPYHVLYPNSDGGATTTPGTLSTNGDPAIWLGTTSAVGLVDRETNGVLSNDATGDDAATSDDEDGIVLNDPLTWQGGGQGSLTATFSSSSLAGGSGCLVVWFDWTHDGDFSDTTFAHTPSASEVVVNQYVTWTGTTHSQSFSFTVPFCEPDPYNCNPGKAALDYPLFGRARLLDVAACPSTPSPTGQAVNGEVEDYLFGVEPTAVELLSFTATGADRSIVLNWETAAELDNLGFNLYRATRVNGEKTQLNAELIPTLVPPGSPFGAIYEYTDTTVRGRRTYYYWLEAVDIFGVAELYGPVSARVGK